jgi:hypothetical protein
MLVPPAVVKGVGCCVENAHHDGAFQRQQTAFTIECATNGEHFVPILWLHLQAKGKENFGRPACHKS